MYPQNQKPAKHCLRKEAAVSPNPFPGFESSTNDLPYSAAPFGCPCYMAEREGFEPSRPFWSLHAFQACALDRSATSPWSDQGAHSVRLDEKNTYFHLFLKEIFVPSPSGPKTARPSLR